MKNVIIKEVQKKWEEIGRYKNPEELNFEIELYKKLLNIFQVGPFYFFIFSPPQKTIEYTSPTIEDVLGYDPNSFSISQLLDIIHPEDLPYFVDFETAVVDFKSKLAPEKLMKYKSRYNYRIQKKDGTYIHILQQSISIQVDEDGAVLRNLVFHTDITDLSPSNKMKLSFIGLEGEPSYYNYDFKKFFSKSQNIFTKREKEILTLMVQGNSSEEISKQFHRSIHTINAHRKNILNKSGCETVNELLVKSIKEGWI